MKSIPAKVQFQYNFVLRRFLPFDVWFQLKPRTAFVKRRLCYKPLPMSAFETGRMWFLQSLLFISEPHGFGRPFFDCHSSISEFVSQILGMFLILILKFRFRIDGLCLRYGVLWNLFRGVLAPCSLGCVSFKTFRSLLQLFQQLSSAQLLCVKSVCTLFPIEWPYF